MATLTTNIVRRSGLVDPALVAATGGGDAMECGPTNWLEINNGGGAPITVTLVIPAARQYELDVAITSLQVTVTNATKRRIGPIDAATFADLTTGLCTITYSAVTSVTVGAFKMQG